MLFYKIFSKKFQNLLDDYIVNDLIKGIFLFFFLGFFYMELVCLVIELLEVMHTYLITGINLFDNYNDYLIYLTSLICQDDSFIVENTANCLTLGIISISFMFSLFLIMVDFLCMKENFWNYLSRMNITTVLSLSVITILFVILFSINSFFIYPFICIFPLLLMIEMIYENEIWQVLGRMRKGEIRSIFRDGKSLLLDFQVFVCVYFIPSIIFIYKYECEFLELLLAQLFFVFFIIVGYYISFLFEEDK